MFSFNFHLGTTNKTQAIHGSKVDDVTVDLRVALIENITSINFLNAD